MFILSKPIIYFFVKKLFFRMFIFQWTQNSNLFICYFGWERDHQLSTYTRIKWWAMGGLPKVRAAVYKKRRYYASHLRTHSYHLFACFWQHFCLIVFCVISKSLALPLFKNDVFVRNEYFFLQDQFLLP